MKEDGCLEIQRDALGRRDGVRPYFAPFCLAGFGHQDVQQVRHTQHVRGYMAKLTGYVTKAQEGPAEAWLETSSSGYQAARMLLQRLQPGEPQMVTALRHGGVFVCSTLTKPLLVRRPDEMNEDPCWKCYCKRPATQEHMTFAEWARLHRTDGVHCGQAYKRLKGGRVALIMHFGSKFEDAFFGQWVTANVSTRRALTDCPAGVGVAPGRRWFALARRLAPELWDSETAIRSWLQTEGSYSTEWVVNFIFTLRAWRAIVDFQPAIAESRQRQYFHHLQAALQTVDMVHQAYLVRGSAGTGKTAVATALCEWAAQQDMQRVAIATPTGLLAQAQRHLERKANVHVDTVATFCGGARLAISSIHLGVRRRGRLH